MSTNARSAMAGLWGRVKNEVGAEHRRGSYLVLLNAAVTGVLGLVFWSVAARSSEAADLGSGSAWIGAIMTVSSVGQLNAYLLLPNYLGRVGGRARRLLLGTYGVTVPVSGLLGFAYWELIAPPEVTAVSPGPWGGALFAGSTALWTIFTLQDAGLAGSRAYGVLPLENGLFGLLKIVLLLAFRDLGILAIPLATLLPLAVVVPAVNTFLIQRLHPDRRPPAHPDAWSGVVRLAAGDWVATSAASIATAYLPVLVVQTAGAERGAAFTVIWALTQAVDMAIGTVGMSATVEMVAAPAMARQIVRGTILRLAALAGAAILVTAVGGRLILELYSPAYLDPGAAILLIVVIGSLPRSVVVVALAVSRAVRRVGWIIALQVTLAVLVVGGTLVLVPELGVVGGAWAWLGAQVVLGTVAGLVAIPRMLAAAKPVTQPVAAVGGEV